MPSPPPDNAEPEHAIEHSNLALCLISGKGGLRSRDPPVVVHQEKGGSIVFVSFVALPEETFRLLVRNRGLYDASADISISGHPLGKWLIAREPKVWHNIACDSVFKFQESYDRQSKVFEPTTIKIRFQHLSKVEREQSRGCLVPIIARRPSPSDGPGYVPPSNDVMQSKFEAIDDGQFLTFVVSFFPPPSSMTFLPSPPIASPEPSPTLVSSSESGSASGSESISQMSDDELQEALSEYKHSRLLLPGRLIPGFGGKLTVEDFSRRYGLSGEIASVLAQMKVKDVHSLSKLYLRELQDCGLALRSINMLRLAVIRFSSESRQ